MSEGYMEVNLPSRPLDKYGTNYAGGAVLHCKFYWSYLTDINFCFPASYLRIWTEHFTSSVPPLSVIGHVLYYVGDSEQEHVSAFGSLVRLRFILIFTGYASSRLVCVATPFLDDSQRVNFFCKISC
ncbi:hypothetical protein Plhal304r1_c034g0106341 [Plasmopara halstedii]